VTIFNFLITAIQKIADNSNASLNALTAQASGVHELPRRGAALAFHIAGRRQCLDTLLWSPDTQRI
jgi:hypothetical protein